MEFIKELLLEFDGPRGSVKKDKGKETSIIRMVLKGNDVSTKKGSTAYSDKTKTGHSFKMYLNDMPEKTVQTKIKKEIEKAIPGAKVSFGPTEESIRSRRNYVHTPFIRVLVKQGTQK